MESVISVAKSPNESNASSPAKSPSHPLLGPDQHRQSGFWSSDAREEAIARGQWELMEMVKNMPESSYELSLKDLVENQETERRDERELTQDPRRAAKPKRIDYHDRNKGLFLNIIMFTSSSSKAKNKKKNGSGKVSSNNKVDHRGENDRGRKKLSDVGGRERKINGPPTGCWPFLCFRRSKTLVKGCPRALHFDSSTKGRSRLSP